MNERELVINLRERLLKPPYLKTWLDEDCEIIELEKLPNHFLLVTVDTSSERVDFPTDAPPEYQGYLSASLALSDIAACGGEPIGILVSCCIPPYYEGKILQVYDGIKEAVTDAETYILGGDTNASSEFSLSVVGIGTVEKDHVLRRGHARVGDLIGVTGELDRFNTGYFEYTNTRNAVDFKRMLVQKPPIQKGKLLASLGVVTSCIDLPDGLVKALEDSRGDYGYRIYDRAIPVKDSKLGYPHFQYNYERASYPAGDVELLFTLPPGHRDLIEAKFGEAQLKIYWIGEVISGMATLIDIDGQILEPKAPGFVHDFKGKTLF